VKIHLQRCDYKAKRCKTDEMPVINIIITKSFLIVQLRPVMRGNERLAACLLSESHFMQGQIDLLAIGGCGMQAFRIP
jgi:hypothetical protein